MYYKQPHYYSGFQCIGGKCPTNCCHGWRIRWSKAEIDKVLNAENISPELRELTEKSFELCEGSEDKYLISFLDNKKCPFETEDRLCRIQNELGAEYLSKACTAYPRTSINTVESVYRFCNMSCPAIMKRLLDDQKCMKLSSIPVEESAVKRVNTINKYDDFKKYKEQQYRDELFDFFYELISDKDLNVEDAILLGALSAEAIEQLVAEKRYELIPDEIDMLRKAVRTPDMVRSVKDAPPHIPAKLAFVPWIVENIAVNSAAPLLKDKDGNPSTELYKLGEENLRNTLKDREFFMRNIALQLLFELDVPFKVPNRSILDNYALYVTVFSCVKLNLIAAMTKDTLNIITIDGALKCEGDDRLIVISSLMVRALCQDTDNAVKIIDILKKKEYDKPPYFPLLVK